MAAMQIEEPPIKPAALQGFNKTKLIMIKFAIRKKIYNILVLATCLIISVSFVIEAKSLLPEGVSVTIQQQNTDINVFVRAPKNTNVQFYMFSTDGILIKQVQMTGTKKFSIENLSKGYYLYELFNKDERLKHGDIQIK